MSEQAGPIRHNLEIYERTTFSEVFVIFEDDDAQVIEDLVITDGDTSATSESAPFTTGDTDKKIVAIDGIGITDGTTMTYVSPTEVTLSIAATETMANVKAALRAEDASTITNHLAQYRESTDATDVAATFDVDDSRSEVGIFVVSLTNVQTDGLPTSGVWDWKVTDADSEVFAWFAGKVIVTKDVSR